MTTDRDLPPDRNQKTTQTEPPDRILGQYGSGTTGPLLIVIAGIHGNEHAGIVAVERVLSTLAREQTPIRGRVVAIVGNRTALARGVRFVDRDLNRLWCQDQVDGLVNVGTDYVEEKEQQELIEAMDDQTRDHRGPIVLIDLHSTSADASWLNNRRTIFVL